MNLMTIYRILKFSFSNAKCSVSRNITTVQILHVKCVNQMNCVRANVLQCGIAKKKK